MRANLSLIPMLLAAVVTTGCKKEAKPLSQCDRLEREIETEVQKGPGACSAASDCVCYQGGANATPCGGVANKDRAARITSLIGDLRARKCFGEFGCLGRVCNPECVNGTCANVPAGRAPASSAP